MTESPPRVRYPRMSKDLQRDFLQSLVARSRHDPASGKPPPVLVFDLDGTLMDNRPRSAAILHEIAGLWESRHPELSQKLRAASSDSLAYLLTDSLKLLGITALELVAEAEEYWKSRFFRDEHLVHDVAIEGSVSFARDCYAEGATLVYLTGRDLPHMSVGTFRSLRDLGFPIGVAGTEVILKPNAEMPDERFKREIAPKLRRIGHVVAAFDNEPGNCNVFLEAYPDCASVLVDTQHMPGAPPILEGVHVVAEFTR